MNQKNSPPSFKPAKICDHGGDPLKQWYVYFYLLIPETGKYKQYREFVSRSHKTKDEKRKAAVELQNTLNQLLEAGIISTSAKVAEKKVENLSVKQAFDKLLAIKSPHLAKRTMDSYNSTISLLIGFLEDAGHGGILVRHFSKRLGSEFVEQLSVRKKLKAKTINNYIGYLRTLFDELISMEIVEENPFSKFKAFKEEEPEIRIWNAKEKEKLFTYLKANDPDMFLIVLLVYRAFLRPKEIGLLQVKDVDLLKGLIRVAGGKSKNNTGAWVTLNSQLVDLLRSRVSGFGPNEYLFSKGLVVGPSYVSSTSTRITERFSLIRGQLEISSELKLYSFKHTGNSELLDAGVSTEVLKQQNRHHSVSMTETYAKRIGAKAIQQLRDLGEV